MELMSMEVGRRERAEVIRSLVSSGGATPDVFRAALADIPQGERDAWLDLVLGIDELPGDRAELPRGCAPYIPCSVSVLVQMIERAQVRPSDVFVDIGSGLNRPGALTHLLTGAAAIGIEIQSELVRASREIATGLNASRLSVVEGDAARLAGFISIGSVFFLYCPFTGARLTRVLDDLGLIARTRPIRVCCVDMPSLSCSWLASVSLPPGSLAVYRSTVHPEC
jgi:hypothetical protein